MEASSNGSVTGCDGCAGEWCSRHSMPKGESHRRLCAANQKYFDFWENGKRPAMEHVSSGPGNLVKRQQKHWGKLHTQIMDSAMLEKWMSSIPGCSTCRRDFRNIVKSIPPRFDDWFAWTVEVHNAVNRKLNRKEWTVEEAKARWTAAFTE